MKRLCLALLFLLCSHIPAHSATYTVALDAMWPPFEFLSKDNVITGYTLDYISAVGREAGFSVKPVHIPWDGIFTSLKTGKAHIVASSVTITEERKKNFLLSDPYFETYQHILLPYDSQVTNLDDLKNGVFGVQTGTTGQFTINELKGFTVKPYDDLIDAITALTQGKLDAVACDYPVARYYANTIALKDRIKLASFSLSDKKEFYGFVVSPNNMDLIKKLNAGIKTIQKKRIDKEIYEKWFGEGNYNH